MTRRNSSAAAVFLLALALALPLHNAPGESGSWPFLKKYDQAHLAQIALPLGGIGTGTVSLGGRGDLRDWEIVNRPAKGFAPGSAFFAIRIKSGSKPSRMRALQGPVEKFQYSGPFGVKDATNPGLPCFRECTFDAGYPFGQVNLSDSSLPVSVKIKAFNPLVPTDPDASGIPIAVLRYEVTNLTADSLAVSVCGSLENFIGNDGTRSLAAKNRNEFRNGDGIAGIFMTSRGVDSSAEQWGTLALTVPASGDLSYRTSWLPNNWGTALLDLWDDLEDDGMLSNRESDENMPKGSLAVRRSIPPRATREFTFTLTWHFPNRFGWSSKRVGNFYATRYRDAWDVAAKTAPQIDRLERETLDFSRAFCASNLPDVVKEAALFNLSTLRSQTCFRTEDGRFFAWEGCGDKEGCCFGSCTHVWNYEQAIAFLFGTIARSMREVEFANATDDIGKMSFRVSLPTGEDTWGKAAADGQMGCIMKVYRDWQLSGDERFLRSLYPNVRKALQFAWLRGGWDADMDGVMEGCQHNTMDVEYYGPNPQMGFWYLGALRAGEKMAAHLGDSAFAGTCRALFANGSRWIDSALFNGRYYVHMVVPPNDRSNILPGLVVGAGARDFVNPDYQLANGCLVDQLVGQYMAHVCNLGYLAQPRNIRTTLESIMKYNYRESLAEHFNCMRTFALGDESALLMASYPDGRPKNPFPYFSEVMTGFEYTAAIGMLYERQIDNGLRCVSGIRARYDGLRRNPYDEAECGHHYGRAMISWAGLLALSGFHYSAVDRTIQLDPSEGPFFWSSGDACGTVSQKSTGAGRTVTLAALRGSIGMISLTIRGHGRAKFDVPRILRPGENIVVEVPANDSTAGVPVLDVSAVEQPVRPPQVVTGEKVYQRILPFAGQTDITMQSPEGAGQIRYSLDGSEPSTRSPIYTGPIILTKSATVRAISVVGGRQSIPSPPVEFHKVEGVRYVDLAFPPSPDHAGQGPLTLVDGRRGPATVAADEWLGFEATDLDAVIDLGEPRQITSVTVRFLSDQRSWVFLPASVEISAGNIEEKTRPFFKRTIETVKIDGEKVEEINAPAKNIKARYLRIRARNVGTCPPWHPGAGKKAWLFADEVTVK